jgi:cytidylate kinase
MELYRAGTKQEARAMMEESDATRKRYFNTMTGHDWACAENYNLSIDTSLFPLEETAEIIIALLKRKGIVT